MLIAGALPGGRLKITTRVCFQQLDRPKRGQTTFFQLGFERDPCDDPWGRSRARGAPSPESRTTPDTGPTLVGVLRQFFGQLSAGAIVMLDAQATRVRALPLS